MFAQRLKQLRTEKKISQSELASTLNISNRTISMYEQGNSTPNTELLSKIADFFHVPVDYLTGNSNVKNMNYIAINEELGLSDKAIQNLTKCFSLNYNTSSFIESDTFIKLMEAYTEYLLLLHLPEPIEPYEYGYDSFDLSNPLDLLQKNFLDHLEDMPSKEAYQVYIGSLLQKLLNSTK